MPTRFLCVNLIVNKGDPELREPQTQPSSDICQETGCVSSI